MEKEEFINALMNPLELNEKCKNCKWNSDENNKNKPCFYIYCTEEEWYK